MASLTSVDKIAKYILAKPVLRSLFVPTARVFTNLSGYRAMGLKFDDLLIEETPIMKKALSRLPDEVSYERVFRMTTAFQMSLSHQLLPKNEQITREQDKPYLIPYVLEAEAEAFERQALDNAVVSKK